MQRGDFFNPCCFIFSPIKMKMTGDETDYSYKDKINIVGLKKASLETACLVSGYSGILEGIQYIASSI